MQFLSRIISRAPSSAFSNGAIALSKRLRDAPFASLSNSRVFSSDSQNDGNDGGSWSNKADDKNFDWNESQSSWSTGLTKDHFDGEAVGHQVGEGATPQPGAVAIAVAGGGGGGGDGDDDLLDRESMEELKVLDAELRRSTAHIDGWEDMLEETSFLLNQVLEPGARGSYLKDSDKAEMYRLHKENPEEYTVERLAKDYRIMRQRVHAILWLKELEEEEEKKLGHPLDDSVELLLDAMPEFFVSHDREFHVASLPYKPDFKVMPEGWDGTTRDPDEVHYEISKKEDDMLYEEFLQRFNFNKMRFKGEVKAHKYSRRRPSEGWNFTVEKLGPRGKRGGGGGWKFVSEPDGSTRPLNETEKVYVKRETPRRRRKILP